jgi:hypothetical protein
MQEAVLGLTLDQEWKRALTSVRRWWDQNPRISRMTKRKFGSASNAGKSTPSVAAFSDTSDLRI